MFNEVLAENTGMLALAERPGFTTKSGVESPAIRFVSCRL